MSQINVPMHGVAKNAESLCSHNGYPTNPVMKVPTQKGPSLTAAGKLKRTRAPCTGDAQPRTMPFPRASMPLPMKTPPNRFELLPLPRYHRVLKQELQLPADSQLPCHHPVGFSAPALDRLQLVLAQFGVELTHTESPPQEQAHLLLAIEEQASPSPEAYQLLIAPAGISIKANSTAGLLHGLHTLTQWINARLTGDGNLVGLEVEDEPSFAERGIMLDVSRDRVPSQETLLALVEELAALKYNKIQLYTEHTFAYPEHPQVWKECSAITPEEIRQLDAHCQAHGMELVPNQQSFGHMHRWLTHPELSHLAECPEGILHPFSPDPEPFGLCPGDPESLKFVAGLYDQLLPNFTSSSVNVGCDETIDLGLGRSAAVCKEKGTGVVYLDFLAQIHGLLAKRDKSMQFWADIILNYPELVPELPKRLPGSTAMLWGYEADHPFEKEAQLVSASGLEFYVCPGTSAWQSIAGRYENMAANLACAARQGQTHGAKGYLVTDWGDRGHLQPLSSCFPAWAMGSDLAWNHESPQSRHSPSGLAQLLAQHFLKDPTAASAQAMISLAQVSAIVNVPWHNASPLSILLTKAQTPFPPEELEALTPEGLQAASDQIDAALETLHLHQMGRHNAAQVLAEMTWGAGLLRFATHLGQARLAAPPSHVLKELAADTRQRLVDELSPLIEEHARLWSSQHRKGGLMRSSKWLECIREDLNAQN
jgi:hexosaminidase